MYEASCCLVQAVDQAETTAMAEVRGMKAMRATREMRATRVESTAHAAPCAAISYNFVFNHSLVMLMSSLKCMISCIGLVQMRFVRVGGQAIDKVGLDVDKLWISHRCCLHSILAANLTYSVVHVTVEGFPLPEEPLTHA